MGPFIMATPSSALTTYQLHMAPAPAASQLTANPDPFSNHTRAAATDAIATSTAHAAALTELRHVERRRKLFDAGPHDTRWHHDGSDSGRAVDDDSSIEQRQSTTTADSSTEPTIVHADASCGPATACGRHTNAARSVEPLALIH